MSTDPCGIEFDTYELVLLRRTRQSGELDAQTQERSFGEHAAYTMGLGAAGHVLAAGPVTGSRAEDEPVSGFGIYQKGSHEQVRELLANDPGVQQGQYTFEVMTWHTPKGSLAFPRRRRSEDG